MPAGAAPPAIAAALVQAEQEAKERLELLCFNERAARGPLQSRNVVLERDKS